MGLTRAGVEPYLIAEDEAIAPKDSLLVWIPDDQLSIALWVGVELVDIAVLTRPPAVEAKGLLTKAPDLTHRIRSGGGMEDIDLVAPLVGQP